MSSFTDVLLRFLDILAVCGALYGAFVFVITFKAAALYEGSISQRLDLLQGKKVTYHWGRFLLLAAVSTAWLIAHNW
jgi:hypothetical protein